MSVHSKPRSGPYGPAARAPSLSSSEHAASEFSQSSTGSRSPIAVDSSILSETLSNIDFDAHLEMEGDSSSDSDLTPMVPWNVRAGATNEGGNTLVTQVYRLTSNAPNLTHIEWRNNRGRPARPRGVNLDTGNERQEKEKDNRGQKLGSNKANKGMAAIPISRDFFLLIALCIGLACALICLARPLVTSLLFDSLIFLT